MTKEECQKKLKEEFLKNKHISDVRVIDMLVIKVHIILFNYYLIIFKCFVLQGLRILILCPRRIGN